MPNMLCSGDRGTIRKKHGSHRQRVRVGQRAHGGTNNGRSRVDLDAGSEVSLEVTVRVRKSESL